MMKFYVVNREAARNCGFQDAVPSYNCHAITVVIDRYGDMYDKKPSVLVVGEGVEFHESLQKCLSGKASSLYFASTGRHAIDYFTDKGETPDIVFTDADLPDMSCRKLKENMEGVENTGATQ